MRYSRVAALALALVIGGGLGMAVADHGVIERTSAAWTDQTHMSATVAAGTWQVPSTCIAYNKNGAQLAGCKVFPERSRYDQWGEPGSQSRSYYVRFNVPADTYTFSFDIDLSAVPGGGSSWSWKHAKALPGGHFTPRDGWTCDELPRLRGTGPVGWNPADINANGLYFPIAESDNGSPTKCA